MIAMGVDLLTTDQVLEAKEMVSGLGSPITDER